MIKRGAPRGEVWRGSGGRNIYPVFFPGKEIPPPSYENGSLPLKCLICEAVLGPDVVLVEGGAGRSKDKNA